MIRILKYGEVKNDEIFSRVVPEVNVEQVVSDIIKDVCKNGDQALYFYCERFDGAKLDTLEVSQEELENAMKEVIMQMIDAIKDMMSCQEINSFFIHLIRNSFSNQIKLELLIRLV